MNRASAFARAYALPTLSGVLYFLSWIGFGIWPLAFVCFLPLLWALRGATPRQALKLGAWMGFVTHLGGYTWVMHLLEVFAGAPLPVAFLGYAALCAAQGFLFGITAWLLRRASLATGWGLWLLLPLALCAVEWLYPLLFQSYTGVALMPVLPLVQIADLGGALLLTALQALVNGALADVLIAGEARPAGAPRRLPPIVPVAAVLASLAAASAYGAVALWRQQAREREAPLRKTGIAQPNVGEVELHANPQASVRALWEQTAELHSRGAELVVWPEVGFNLWPVNLALPALGKQVSGNIPVTLVAGLARGEPPRKIWNSAVLVSDGQLGDHYDKIKLLAFGEYIPLGDYFPVLYQWSPMAAPLQRGTTTAPLRDGRWLLAASICYEDILPGAVRETMKDHGQGRAHVLVNLTNDSWYGTGHEQEQHLMLAALRSIEHRRWLVRATSTGISAFVDSMGRVVQRIGRDQRGVALRAVPMLEGDTLYQRLGDWPGWLSAAALLAIALRARLRKQPAT